MLSQYEKELSTHYAQVRKRLRGDPPKRIIKIPPRPLPEPKPQPAPVECSEPEQIPDFVLYVNNAPLVRTLVYSKRDFVVIENEQPQAPVPRKSFTDVLKDVSRETDVPAKMILGTRRQRYIMEARRYFWHRVACECPHLSIADIGRRSGYDHTSVLHGLKRYAELNGLPYARGSVE